MSKKIFHINTVVLALMAIMACTNAQAKAYEVWVTVSNIQQQEYVKEEQVQKEITPKKVVKKDNKQHKITGTNTPIVVHSKSIFQAYLPHFHTYKECSFTKRAARQELAKSEMDLVALLHQKITPFAAFQIQLT